ncbi:nuclear mRNA export, poly(A)+RNA binding protein [Gamsiella multidivaricata]|nr:nuclear mRNA export, poly(A)+RNA binding protein [Gamsiella multidivaricata]
MLSGGRQSRGGGRNGRGGNIDRDQNEPRVTGNAETGLFTNAARRSGAGGGGGSGPVRQAARRGSGRIGGGTMRGSHALPPRPRRGGAEDQDGDLNMGGEKKNLDVYIDHLMLNEMEAKNIVDTFTRHLSKYYHFTLNIFNKLESSPYQRPKRSTRSSTTETLDHEGTVIIFVTGQKEGLTTDSGLHDFLSRKASPAKITITSKRSNETSGVVSFVVGDITQARALRKLTGIRYKGQKLTIKTSEDNKILGQDGAGSIDAPQRAAVAPTYGTIEVIRNFIRSRYSSGFLNLENMAQDSILRSAKIIPPGQAKGRTDVGTVMMKVAAEMFPEYYKDLEYLSGNKKLPKLRELILLDNPVRDRDIAKNKDDLGYRSAIVKLFPTIEILDQVPVAPKISFGLGDILKDADAPEVAVLPVPTKGNFFDNPQAQEMVLEFLTGYLKLFDNDRSRLVHVYDNNATFSYATMTLLSPLQKSRGDSADNWAAYVPQSRNLTRIKELDQRTKRLLYGSKDIIEQGLKMLPETKHDISDASKFVIDAWQTGELLPAPCIYINMHGEFEEVHHGRQGVLKSFDRSFIIAAAPQESLAAQNGWKCIIISDQLTVRGYNGSEAWKPDVDFNVTPAMAAAVAAPSAFSNGPVPQQVQTVPSTPQAPMPGVSSDQHAQAQELQHLTGLNYPYAIQCLAATGWDIAKSVALVGENRANIPQDAWQQPTFQ